MVGGGKMTFLITDEKNTDTLLESERIVWATDPLFTNEQSLFDQFTCHGHESVCILRSPTAIVAMLNDRTAELIGQSENHYSTVFLT